MQRKNFYICLCFFLSLMLSFRAQATNNVQEIDPAINSRETKQILSNTKVSKSDIKEYRKAFEAIEDNNHQKAQKLIRKLDDNTLLGHLLAELYLSKTYKSNYKELENWLEKYPDHPQSEKIYKLALQKVPSSETCSFPALKLSERRFGPYWWNYSDFASLSPTQQSELSKQISKFRQSINSGKTRGARNILENKNFQKQMPKKHYSTLAATLATKYLLDNENILAQKWAEIAVSKDKNATAYWISGLASWRLKQFKSATSSFKALGKMDDDEWLVAAGAYWASRSYSKLNNKIQAKIWLKIAAKYHYTFYGILANHQLGQNPAYQWNSMSYYNNTSPQEYISDLLCTPAIKRTVLLIFCQEYKLAEQEIRNLPQSLTPGQKEALLFLAHKYRAHSLVIYLSKQLASDGKDLCYDYFSYPIPHWQPQNGWRLDNSLLLAIARQESAFAPKANSPAGAKGLLQLLPNTAYHITKDISLRQDYRPLFQAEYNLELGQQYVEYLLNKPYIEGNLFYLLVAYNAGPGNLYKWLKTIKDNNDPLLFIELVPSKETRIYIERVMANFWIYQMRQGNNTPTLEAVAENKWPLIK